MKRNHSLVWPVLACLFAALIVIGTYIAVPLPGTLVPLVLQNFFVILAALLLGPLWGTVAVLIYLALGVVGLPVFSRGGSGLAHFVGPTGGYLIGYVLASVVMGFVAQTGRGITLRARTLRNAFAAILGVVVIYGCGCVWYKLAVGVGWGKALVGGVLLFLPGDAVKVLIAAPLAARVQSWLADTLTESGLSGRVHG